MRISDWSSDVCSSDLLWGEGYSEPGAGSDLAALKTHARRDGDGWILNGQKTLGTAAHICQWMLVLARSDQRSEEHTSELQSLMRTSYAVFCLKKKKQK